MAKEKTTVSEDDLKKAEIAKLKEQLLKTKAAFQGTASKRAAAEGTVSEDDLKKAQIAKLKEQIAAAEAAERQSASERAAAEGRNRAAKKEIARLNAEVLKLV